MRLCRFEIDGQQQVGFYFDDSVIPLTSIAQILGINASFTGDLIPLLPGGDQSAVTTDIASRWQQLDGQQRKEASLPVEQVKLLVPVPNPSKLLLLAGNYSKHIEEGGGRAEERAKTFPYVFMKPPGTTLTHAGDPVVIPAVSPDQIDWEVELGVIIGRECKGVSEADALDYVAGYTVINDISDRGFRPNSDRNERPKDTFFDWQHGKWHDTFCPMGPCVLPADELSDPQQVQLTLRVNGHIEQNAPATEMVFPVAAVIEFISSFATLQPGDIISTGTPDGVGKAKGKFLKPGDLLEAEISGIGVLRNPVE